MRGRRQIRPKVMETRVRGMRPGGEIDGEQGEDARLGEGGEDIRKEGLVVADGGGNGVAVRGAGGAGGAGGTGGAGQAGGAGAELARDGMAAGGGQVRFWPCPNCSAAVPVRALACPDCGSDARTGWNELAAIEFEPKDAFEEEKNVRFVWRRRLALWIGGGAFGLFAILRLLREFWMF